jgi:hypothetical protein
MPALPAFLTSQKKSEAHKSLICGLSLFQRPSDPSRLRLIRDSPAVAG